MDNKEAINALMAHRVLFVGDFGWDKHTIEALDFAIASLINGDRQTQCPCEKLLTLQNSFLGVLKAELKAKQEVNK